jgi:hypothetical protein
VMLALTHRPNFSACVAVALVGLLAGVSNAKFASLREPFVFSDLSLFSQLFSHPRLYLPFLSAKTVAAIAVGVLAVVAGFVIDTPIDNIAVTALLAAALCLASAYVLAKRVSLALDANEDQRRHGFFAVFVAYLLNGLRPATFRAFERAIATSAFTNEQLPSSCPDVIVIQSESFFDIRRAAPQINSELYKHYDAVVSESVQHGALSVPAWGANTMRTEFSMLTGMPSEKLGYARFYPYAFIRRACPSLAGWFRRAGYKTLAIHPYYADFFGRDRVFPLMHFDRFQDIEAFADAPRAGPYVADDALAERIIAELDTPREHPAFIFTMTMENHGPLHLETVEKGEAARWHDLGDANDWRDLTAYLRHIANADAMIGKLINHLKARRRDTVLCFYGDHVPALPHVFSRLGEQPERSHYFIWRNFGDRPAQHQDRSVDMLGIALIDALETASRNHATTSPLKNKSRI